MRDVTMGVAVGGCCLGVIDLVKAKQNKKNAKSSSYSISLYHCTLLIFL